MFCEQVRPTPLLLAKCFADRTGIFSKQGMAGLKEVIELQSYSKNSDINPYTNEPTYLPSHILISAFARSSIMKKRNTNSTEKSITGKKTAFVYYHGQKHKRLPLKASRHNQFRSRILSRRAAIACTLNIKVIVDTPSAYQFPMIGSTPESSKDTVSTKQGVSSHKYIQQLPVFGDIPFRGLGKGFGNVHLHEAPATHSRSEPQGQNSISDKAHAELTETHLALNMTETVQSTLKPPAQCTSNTSAKTTGCPPAKTQTEIHGPKVFGVSLPVASDESELLVDIQNVEVPKTAINSDSQTSADKIASTNKPEKIEQEKSASKFHPTMDGAKASLGLGSAQSLSLKKLNLNDLTGFLTIDQAREYYPWIGTFHPENCILHPSVPFLAVLFNETGTWSKEHILLLATNNDLSDQVNWEIRVALFFKTNHARRLELFECLCSLPREEALMIIALRTAEAAHEVILAPSMDCDLSGVSKASTVDAIKSLVSLLYEALEKKVEDAEMRCNEIQGRILLANLTESDVWWNLNFEDRLLLNDLAKARILLWQLSTCSPYFLVHTGLVHLRITLWEPSCPIAVKFHDIVRHLSPFASLNQKGADDRLHFSKQYGIILAFLSDVSVEVSVDVKNLDSLVPFELLISQEQKSLAASYMRSVTCPSSSVYFVAPPAPINKTKTYYSIEGLISPMEMAPKKNTFESWPSAISLSKFARFCSFCLSLEHLLDTCPENAASFLNFSKNNSIAKGRSSGSKLINNEQATTRHIKARKDLSFQK
ncbi:hypothetical protein METBIDRAFT_230703 [Metschnikowia bicuspidata var. bicuspidata NRRL YB-4993]|uniref:Uncharacterized protein n=1 Tax=Metschnikowia bicuspidata var. bicuspidata NRRL YB-4993 TaxID=869754 RepID=A0A1A0H1U6_9ASCO|nr:hypothetical protein METBIDRAFT_230703 [Metschnikowia bicuspidata var. bicuspidata NRRL YB-4993]OBA18001.1 hypothetical protein METBIDRAFT_230703 [Metschnikowia bicuspidata var. bicuspidata NRRL YB-4993]